MSYGSVLFFAPVIMQRVLRSPLVLAGFLSRPLLAAIAPPLQLPSLLCGLRAVRWMHAAFL